MSDSPVPLRPVNSRDVPYPVHISESRYGGIYSGGQWIVVAGLYHPREQCDAWGGDVECGTFWTRRETQGPEFTVDIERPSGRAESRKTYAASGNDPNELLVELFEHYGDVSNDN